LPGLFNSGNGMLGLGMGGRGEPRVGQAHVLRRTPRSSKMKVELFRVKE